MPLYEYECESCGHRFELIQRFADPPAERCASCGKGPIHKLLSAPAFHFKGTGWYVTDYGNKKSDGSPKTDSGLPPAADVSPAAPASTSAASETKPSSSGDSKPAASESSNAPAADSKAAEKSSK
jgi:putative FmdB family regulatory protein